MNEIVYFFKLWWLSQFGTEVTGSLEDYNTWTYFHKDWFSDSTQKAYELYNDVANNNKLNFLAYNCHSRGDLAVQTLPIQERIDLNFISLNNYKSDVLSQLSNESLQRGNALIPQYKKDNALLGVTGYTETQKIQYANTLSAFRTEYYRVKALIDVATTVSEIDTAINGVSFPTNIIV